MAGSATIGALRVVLGADTALFESGLKNAQKDLDAFHRRVTQIGTAIGASIGTAAVGLGVALGHAFHQADELGKMAQRIGIPVEQLSGLRLAADLSGVSMENLGTSIGRLSRNMSEIAGGATNTASRAFQALRISVTNSDGSLKTSAQIMDEVADRFRSMQDGAGKTALAIAIFGRSGAQMIPMLNQGAEALREAREEAEQLGLVVSRRTALAAEAFNDNLRRLRLVTEGVALQLTAQLAPAFAQFTGQMVEAAKQGNVVKSTAEGIISVFGAVAREISVTTVLFRNIGAELSALGDVLAAGVNMAAVIANFRSGRISIEQMQAAFSGLKQATENYGAVQQRIEFEVDEAATRFRNFNHVLEQTGFQFDKVGKLGTGARAPILATENALDKFVKTQQRSIANSLAEASTVGVLAGQRERLAIILQGQAIAAENNIRLSEAQRVKLDQLGVAAQNAAMRLAGATITQENLTSWEKYRQEIEKLQVLLGAGEISLGTYERAAQKAADTANMSFKAASEGISASFTEIANSMGDSNSKIVKAAQVFGAATAFINTLVAQSQAMASMLFPANLVAAATVAAKGFALVAAIKGFAAPKMATGGSLRMPGLPGAGVDKQLMVARVRPDEQVDIWRPGEGPDQRRGGSNVSNVTIRIADPFGREVIARVIDGVNDLVADGYRLKVTA